MSCDGPQGEVIGPNAPRRSARYSQARAQRLGEVLESRRALAKLRRAGACRMRRVPPDAARRGSIRMSADPASSRARTETLYALEAVAERNRPVAPPKSTTT